MRWGFYSELAAQEMGTTIWQHENGTYVHVTAVLNSPDSFYGWQDAQMVGPVTEWVSNGRKAIWYREIDNVMA